jgi:hypothetical protein
MRLYPTPGQMTEPNTNTQNTIQTAQRAGTTIPSQRTLRTNARPYGSAFLELAVR